MPALSNSSFRRLTVIADPIKIRMVLPRDVTRLVRLVLPVKLLQTPLGKQIYGIK
jgi:hypothetical protein